MHGFKVSELDSRTYDIRFPELAPELELYGIQSEHYDMDDKSLVFKKKDMEGFFRAFMEPLEELIESHYRKASQVCKVKK